MEAVTFQGREYIKAISLALKYRYTPDYLGQLARAKKVDARLVGRAWYINEESLLEHRDGKYKLTGESEITEKKAINNYLSRVAVEPYLKNKTARSVLRTGVSVSRVSYEEDEQQLMPKIRKYIEPTRLKVNLAEAENLKITTENKQPVNFKAEPLPDVALSGTLVIKDISEVEEPTPIPEPKVVTVLKIPKKTVMVRARRPAPSPLPPAVTQKPASHPELAPKLRAAVAPASFTPVSIPNGQPVERSGLASFVVPALTAVVAFLISFGLLATNLEIYATANDYDSKLNLALANIFLLFP